MRSVKRAALGWHEAWARGGRVDASPPEVIRLAVLMYVRFPLSLWNVEDLLHERGIDLYHETVRLWWNRFGPMFAADIRHQRVSRMRGFHYWKWHVYEVYVRINGEMHYLARAVDHEGEVPGKLCHQNSRQGGRAAFSEEGAEAAWQGRGYRHRRAAFFRQLRVISGTNIVGRSADI